MDYTAIVAAVDFGTALTAIGSVFVAAISVALAIVGGKKILRTVRGA